MPSRFRFLSSSIIRRTRALLSSVDIGLPPYSAIGLHQRTSGGHAGRGEERGLPGCPWRSCPADKKGLRSRLGHLRDRAELLQQAQSVKALPVFHELAASDAGDI